MLIKGATQEFFYRFYFIFGVVYLLEKIYNEIYVPSLIRVKVV